MNPKNTYPDLDHFINGYLNQDFELWGDTLEAIVSCYKEAYAAGDFLRLIADTKRFSEDHPDDLDQAFLSAYGFNFDPVLWGMTTTTFFSELERLIREPAKPAKP